MTLRKLQKDSLCYRQDIRYSNNTNKQQKKIIISHVIHAQVEMGEKEQKLEALQSKVSEVKKFSQSPETPAKLQVLKIFLLLFFM